MRVLCEEGRVDICLHSLDLCVMFVGVQKFKLISLFRSGGLLEERMEGDFSLPIFEYLVGHIHQ